MVNDLESTPDLPVAPPVEAVAEEASAAAFPPGQETAAAAPPEAVNELVAAEALQAEALETVEVAEALETTAEVEAETVELVVRLLVGLALEGGDTFIRRLRDWHDAATLETAITEPTTATSLLLPDDSTRQALIGLFLSSAQLAKRPLTTANRTAGRLVGRFMSVFSPVTNSRLLHPLQQRLDDLATRGEGIVEQQVQQWIALGRSEEPQLRSLARHATNDTLDELIRHISKNPELQALVQEQGVGLANEVVGGVRSRTVSADALVERIARSLLRRPSASAALPEPEAPSPSL